MLRAVPVSTLARSSRASTLLSSSLKRHYPQHQCRLLSSASSSSAKDEQKAAYNYYKRQHDQRLWIRFKNLLRFNNNKNKNAVPRTTTTLEELNIRLAWYGTAIVVGFVAATYAAVPLYKVFCQTTGFGGTTQRVLTQEDLPQPDDAIGLALRKARGWVQYGWYTLNQKLSKSTGGTKVHTWTDDDAAERLASMKPVKGHELITIRFDTTVDDELPWSFEPVQDDVKVVPGETALSFFRVSNTSKQAITGVATYNVNPPSVGLYFQKIQCFCFEEQRLLPGETVDMPVFFFIDPDFCNDPHASYERNITLSYTFFQTDVDDEEEDEEDEEVQEEQRDIGNRTAA